MTKRPRSEDDEEEASLLLASKRHISSKDINDEDHVKPDFSESEINGNYVVNKKSSKADLQRFLALFRRHHSWNDSDDSRDEEEPEYCMEDLFDKLDRVDVEIDEDPDEEQHSLAFYGFRIPDKRTPVCHCPKPGCLRSRVKCSRCDNSLGSKCRKICRICLDLFCASCRAVERCPGGLCSLRICFKCRVDDEYDCCGYCNETEDNWREFGGIDPFERARRSPPDMYGYATRWPKHSSTCSCDPGNRMTCRTDNIRCMRCGSKVGIKCKIACSTCSAVSCDECQNVKKCDSCEHFFCLDCAHFDYGQGTCICILCKRIDESDYESDDESLCDCCYTIRSPCRTYGQRCMECDGRLGEGCMSACINCRAASCDGCYKVTECRSCGHAFCADCSTSEYSFGKCLCHLCKSMGQSDC